MSLKHLQPFQVYPDQVDQKEIANLIKKVSIDSKISEIQRIFDLNISLCAYLLKAYIDYDEIYFLSINLIGSSENRPDYLCGCYHQKKGIGWYAIVCAGTQEQTWDDDLQLTSTAKYAFDRLNYCTSNLDKILVANKLVETVDRNRVYGLLIIGQDKEFFGNRRKQERKRDINENSPIKLRTYGAFLRSLNKDKSKNWLNLPVSDLLDLLRKPL